MPKNKYICANSTFGLHFLLKILNNFLSHPNNTEAISVAKTILVIVT